MHESDHAGLGHVLAHVHRAVVGDGYAHRLHGAVQVTVDVEFHEPIRAEGERYVRPPAHGDGSLRGAPNFLRVRGGDAERDAVGPGNQPSARRAVIVPATLPKDSAELVGATRVTGVELGGILRQVNRHGHRECGVHRRQSREDLMLQEQREPAVQRDRPLEHIRGRLRGRARVAVDVEPSDPVPGHLQPRHALDGGHVLRIAARGGDE